MTGVMVGGGQIPGIVLEVMGAQRIILSDEFLGGDNRGKNGEPPLEPGNPTVAKSAITVIDQQVLVEGDNFCHNSMLELGPGRPVR
jgi:hypothetical protein